MARRRTSRRLDWGLDGALALVADARPGDVAVVVDVLSFTTTLTVAVEQGVMVHPYPWRREGAAAYAAERGATLAAGRREGSATARVSLSPVSFLGVTGLGRVVLPSPNGSAIAFALADAGRHGRRRLSAQRARGAQWLRAGRRRASVWSPPANAGRTDSCDRRSRTCGEPAPCWPASAWPA